MSAFVVVDTDIVSFLLKGDTRAAAYRKHLENATLALSFMTVAELYQWAFVRKWGAYRLSQLEEHLRSYLIVPYDLDLCRTWARIAVERQQAARSLSRMLGSLPQLCILVAPL